MSFNGAGTRTLLGEVKWSDKPFARREVERLAKAFASLPVPPEFSQDVRRVLFLASAARDVPQEVSGVQILSASEVIVGWRANA